MLNVAGAAINRTKALTPMPPYPKANYQTYTALHASATIAMLNGQVAIPVGRNFQDRLKGF
jgi:hypothetical protein